MKEMPQQENVDLIFVMDRSGSMSVLKQTLLEDSTLLSKKN